MAKQEFRPHQSDSKVYVLNHWILCLRNKHMTRKKKKAKTMPWRALDDNVIKILELKVADCEIKEKVILL